MWKASQLSRSLLLTFHARHGPVSVGALQSHDLRGTPKSSTWLQSRSHFGWLAERLCSTFDACDFKIITPTGSFLNRTNSTDPPLVSTGPWLDPFANSKLHYQRIYSAYPDMIMDNLWIIYGSDMVYLVYIWIIYLENCHLYLVGGDWNMNCIFPYIGNVIIPIDFHIVQRGRYTTNQIYRWSKLT